MLPQFWILIDQITSKQLLFMFRIWHFHVKFNDWCGSPGFDLHIQRDNPNKKWGFFQQEIRRKLKILQATIIFLCISFYWSFKGILPKSTPGGFLKLWSGRLCAEVASRGIRPSPQPSSSSKYNLHLSARNSILLYFFGDEILRSAKLPVSRPH